MYFAILFYSRDHNISWSWFISFLIQNSIFFKFTIIASLHTLLRLPVQKNQLFQGANSEIVHPISGSRQLKTYPLLPAHTPFGQLCFRWAAWFQTRPFFMTLACVASVSNRVITRKLERKQKTVPLPLPRHSFFLLLSQLSRRTSRGNACYAGYHDTNSIHFAYRIKCFLKLTKLKYIFWNKK